VALLEVAGVVVGLAAGDSVEAGLLETAELVGVALLNSVEGKEVARGEAAVQPLTASTNAAPASTRARRWVGSRPRVTGQAYSADLRPELRRIGPR